MRFGVTIAIVAALAGRAMATPESDAADELLADGVELAETGDYARACARFTAARRLRDDVWAQRLEAGCQEQLGRVATATRGYEHMRKLAEAAGDDKSAAIAVAGIARLTPRLAHVELRVSDNGARGSTPRASRARMNAVITVDGQALARDAWDQPIALDAGRHEIYIESPGAPRATTHVDLVEGQTAHIRLIASSPPSRQRRLGIAALAIGGTAVAVGGGFGLAALSAWRDARDNGCDSAGVCRTTEAHRDLATARRRADVATWTIAGGAAIGIAGLAALLLAPRDDARSWTISPTITKDSAGASWKVTIP